MFRIPYFCSLCFAFYLYNCVSPRILPRRLAREAATRNFRLFLSAAAGGNRGREGEREGGGGREGCPKGQSPDVQISADSPYPFLCRPTSLSLPPSVSLSAVGKFGEEFVCWVLVFNAQPTGTVVSRR